MAHHFGRENRVSSALHRVRKRDLMLSTTAHDDVC